MELNGWFAVSDRIMFSLLKTIYLYLLINSVELVESVFNKIWRRSMCYIQGLYSNNSSALNPSWLQRNRLQLMQRFLGKLMFRYNKIGRFYDFIAVFHSQYRSCVSDNYITNTTRFYENHENETIRYNITWMWVLFWEPDSWMSLMVLPLPVYCALSRNSRILFRRESK